MSGDLCFSCYDHITFQLFGQTPGSFNREMKRYTDAIYEGMTVKCSLCDSTAVYNRDETSGKWRLTYKEANECHNDVS